MLKTIRNLNFGWLLLPIAIVFILAGLSMQAKAEGGNTLLCFDAGCVYVQGLSNVVLGSATIIFAVFLILRKSPGKTSAWKESVQNQCL